MKVYLVTINGTSWGTYQAPTARAARDAAKRRWQIVMRMSEPIRSIECHEIED